MGFSKKRFFWTLGISVVVWVSSAFVQLFDKNFWPNGISILGMTCSLTGYPIARCFSQQQFGQLILTCFSNILIWFFGINLLGELLGKKPK